MHAAHATPLLVFARVLGLSFAVVTTGCAHSASRSPDATQESEIAQLRRENAGLRQQIQHLEERLRLRASASDWAEIEAEANAADEGANEGANAAGKDTGDGWITADIPATAEAGNVAPGDGPRQLPVIKLTPEGRSIETAPASGEAPTSVGRPGAAIALAPEADEPATREPPASEATTGTYRLVGSKLVEASQRPRASKARERTSKVVRAYEAAMAVYRDGRYAEAEAAFAAIVADHPNHAYADNALYWQGEAAYDQAQYAEALAAFTGVVERYGGGNKAPDALLKIGLCYGRLGDGDNARDVLTQLIAAYPRAPASKLAKRKLAEMAQP